MGKEKIQERILKKIREDHFDAFTAKDFIEISNIKTINKNLERMSNDGIARRIITGVYDIPEFSSILNEFSVPSIPATANAIARANNWKISPSGLSALNYLGLSTQVPAQYIYVSSGPYKIYSINGTQLIFKHTNNRLMFDASPSTSLLIQAIKAISRNNITVKHKNLIRDLYKTNLEKKLILKESKMTTAWIYEVIKETLEG